MNQLSDRLNSLSPSATLAMSQKSGGQGRRAGSAGGRPGGIPAGGPGKLTPRAAG